MFVLMYTGVSPEAQLLWLCLSGVLSAEPSDDVLPPATLPLFLPESTSWT